LPAFSDTTWHESNHYPLPQSIINRHNTHITITILQQVLSTLIGILIGAVGAFYVSKELGLGLDMDSNAQGLRRGPLDNAVEMTNTHYSPTRSEVSEGSPMHWQERIQQREPLFQGGASPAAVAAGAYQALGDSSAHAPADPAKV
jgi:hypothetical protein